MNTELRSESALDGAARAVIDGASPTVLHERER